VPQSFSAHAYTRKHVHEAALCSNIWWQARPLQYSLH